MKIGETVFENWKDGVDPFFMVLFSESEKRVAPFSPPEGDEEDDLLEEDEKLPRHLVEYVTTVPVLKSRLDFFGFTMDITKRAFEIGKQREIESLQERMNLWRARTDDSAQALSTRYERGLELVSSANAQSWMEAVREVVHSPWKTYPDEIRTLADYFQPVPEMRFPGDLDPRFRLRLELEVAQSDAVVLDVTELVNGGYYSHLDPLTQFALDDLPAYERERCHIIVLTEGSTDKFYIETAFNLLHPELSNYVCFLDFDGWNVPGGASFLESMVRSFVAAGIRDRIIAVFDNDTAGFAAHAKLQRLKLPSNVRSMRYPDLPLAMSYPTLGPSGTTTMNINGSAASIELYLGEDVLREKDGSLIPIQWKSLDPLLRRFQGEIVDKRGCLKRYSEKLDKARADISDRTGPKWRDLQTVVDAILGAFTVADGDDLIELARSQVGCGAS